MIRIRFFGPGEKIKKGFRAEQYKAMHEEKFWSNWPEMREVKKNEKKQKLTERKKKREKKEKRKREEEKEENETEIGKRRCEGFVSVEAFEIFGQGRDLESCGDVYWS